MARSIEYKLDKVRNIKMNNEAVERYEDLTGKIFLQLDLAKPTAKQMIAIIWAGMVHEDPAISYEEVRALLDEYSDLSVLYEKAVAVAMAAFPEPKQGKPGDAEKVNKAGKNVRRA